VFFSLKKKTVLHNDTKQLRNLLLLLPYLDLSVLPQAVGNMQRNINTYYNIRFQVLMEVNMKWSHPVS
jgi:hypothetical protein